MRRWRLFSLISALSLVLVACGGQGVSPSGSGSVTPTSSAPASTGPFTAMTYPEAGPADCSYGGEFSQIKATDEHTVEFTLCYPDPAFLAKLAFASNEIHDTASLEADMENHLILAKPNGTGPYMLDRWQRGDHISLTANPNYWGEKAKAATLEFRWNAESAARLAELQAGTVDGIDNPGPNDMETISNDSALQLLPREALNTFYLGFTNTHDPWSDPKVRQALAMGIDRQRIVDNFYPTGSEVATHFTPCNVPFGCEGEDWYDFNPTEAKRLLAEAGFPNGFDTTINYRDVVRGYLPDPNVVSQEIQTQLRDNLGINATIEVMESAAFLDSSSKGELTGLYLLGWGADFPDPVNFLDYHFNNPNNVQFGKIDASITEPLSTAAQTLDETARKAAYEEANNAIKAFVPMVPIAHGASAAAYLADVDGAQASPLTSEWFATMDPGGRDTFRWMQNAEPISLYCGDETDGETLRICEQINEPLYQYAINGVDPEPALATGCEANDDGTVWTCALREGVTFHNGAAFDANDVVVSFALQWDAEHPLHIGRQGLFEYWGGLWGANLNPPPAEPAS